MNEDKYKDEKKILEATLTSLIMEMEYSPTREFLSWRHRRQMRSGKKNYIGISYEEVTPSWLNLMYIINQDWLQYNHTQYCLGELEYNVYSGEARNSPRPWRLSIYGTESVEKLIYFANRLGEECKVSIDVTIVRKHPKTLTWKEYRENKEDPLPGEDW